MSHQDDNKAQLETIVVMSFGPGVSVCVGGHDLASEDVLAEANPKTGVSIWMPSVPFPMPAGRTGLARSEEHCHPSSPRRLVSPTLTFTESPEATDSGPSESPAVFFTFTHALEDRRKSENKIKFTSVSASYHMLFFAVNLPDRMDKTTEAAWAT
ncbi:unnamed protein product [Protopolystoma xenopodis]|uniref:Uncharacterized protein n=1 Tax=Protopolystoma xenopodis TaxID=117903 RepID=A0A448XLN8_9PLAT|nr:unnamed protein product [Protopolystoma xenopodis]